MDRDKIKILMGIGSKVSEVLEEDMLKLLRSKITDVYIMNGVHRNMTEENFKQEVAFCAKNLRDAMISDRLYCNIRDAELPYIFEEGIKGRLGNDKDIVLTFKSIVRWVEAYVMHPIRREASDDFFRSIRAKQKQIPESTMSDDTCASMMKTAWKEYCEYRENQKNDKSGIKSLGEVLGMPMSCYDYGGIRISYMRRNGYASDDDTLVDVMERAYNNGGKFEKVCQ